MVYKSNFNVLLLLSSETVIAFQPHQIKLAVICSTSHADAILEVFKTNQY